MKPEPSPLARALGRLPTGLYIATTRHEGRTLGFLASFVMQVGIEPPVVSVAVGRERGPLAAMRAAGRFALSILDKESRGLMAPFLKPTADGRSPFDGLALASAPRGTPVLAESLAWIECRLVSEHEVPDHVVLFGEVEAGELLREGEPAVHLRRNGLGY
jgi:flavin reductase (DIM6/NTAB) family NADH-FMN oxidoreductase RutF